MNDKEKLPQTKPDLELAFDVGHSSIGWAVLRTTGPVRVESCGAVIFRADDCLVSARRAYRRQRRHIRSTRQRIARIKTLLNHLGVLDKEELDRPGCAWPWQLAARVLRHGAVLTWPELWDVLRWYAHNRGYDGNRRWSTAEAKAAAEDTEKEQNAKSLMEKHGVNSMAETFCKELGVAPAGEKRASMVRFKGLNVAFPRAVVEGEVRRILRSHSGKLPKVDATLERALLANDNQDKAAWQAIPCPGLKLPKRYEGALLFGQLVPRFDNRIISTCPISGQKVPSRHAPEFLNFRWAMLLANVRVGRPGEQELSPLTVVERKSLDKAMRDLGAMTAEEFKKRTRQVSGAVRDNLDAMLMHPDAKESLVLDPVQKLAQSPELSPFWRLLPERLQKRARGQWRRGKTLTLGRFREWLDELHLPLLSFDAEVTRQIDAASTSRNRNRTTISREMLLNKPLATERLDQRAAFARPVLKKAAEEVMAGRHPKEAGGCLFTTEEMKEAQLTRELAEQTNNHLVRHRLLILQRLLGDIIKEFADGDRMRIATMAIEVNRDLRDMAGMTAKEKAQDLGRRIANHHHVVKKLEEDASFMAVMGRRGAKMTAGLIRKARVADDLEWTCPYTGQRFEPVDLLTQRVDKDHIVPRADRASDSLDSLVLTFSAVNKWKGKRTACQFVHQEQSKAVPDLPNLSIMSFSRYKQHVEALDSFKGHDDDRRRKKRRKELLLLAAYEEKQFVPRDLTTTSQLVRLGAQALQRTFLGAERKPPVVSLPGAVTAAVRKAWKVLGCLGLAAPQVLDEAGEVKKKDEIRDITHLHHALDACVLALASHFIPNNGRVWELIVKRALAPAEERELASLGVFAKDSQGRFQMRDLEDRLKGQVRERLAEKRVVQHIPARMDGMRVEQNTWRVLSVSNGIATLQQCARAPDGSRAKKATEEKVTKLLGVVPTGGIGKLQSNRGALVIPENFGVALVQPEPVIIPFHKVWPRLSELRSANAGRMPQVLRNGQLILVPHGKNFKGVWRVFSAKNNASGLALDIGSPDAVRLKNKTEGHKINVRLATLLKDGMQLLRPSLTGVRACPTTSSASTPPSAH